MPWKPTGSESSPVEEIYADAATHSRINGADIENAPTGEIMKAQGNGSLAFEAPGGGGLWTEDANSPISVTNTGSVTYTLSQEYDLVKVIVQAFTNEGGSNQHLYLQVNGDTGSNYRYTKIAGTTNTTMPNIRLVEGAAPNLTVSGSFELTSSLSSEIALLGPFATGYGNAVSVGNNGSVTPPLTSLTIGGELYNMSIQARVYGWNGQI